MMEKEVPKKTSVILILIAIILAITMTMYILNYFQTPKVIQAVKESASSGEISLTVLKPPVVRDESGGSVSLTLLSSGG